MADIKIFTSSNIPFNCQEVANSVLKTLNQTGKVSIELDIVEEDYIKDINRKFRGIDRVTDVLSFPSLDGIRYKDVLAQDFPHDLESDGSVFLGSIIICESRAKEQAKEYNHSEEREFCYLFCHGLLHLFGYDHIEEKDDFEMRELANKALKSVKVLR